jgi:hypothetical protein
MFHCVPQRRLSIRIHPAWVDLTSLEKPFDNGVIAHHLGFQSIFWSLVILSGLSLLSILSFLPETTRTIGGNGTVPLYGIHKPFLYYITGQKEA